MRSGWRTGPRHRYAPNPTGSTGSGTATDHICVLVDSLAQLPLDPAEQEVIVRADSAGWSYDSATECEDRQVRFVIGHQLTVEVASVLVNLPQQADVFDTTRPWPSGLRMIARRELPHPGAQLSLFDTIDGHRHTAFITNQASADITVLELRHRQRARAENVIRDAKACGLANLPFDDIVSNDVWMQLCLTANDLLAWAQRIGCVGQLRRATPKTIRHRLLHIAARITPRSGRLHLDRTWPWTHVIIDAGPFSA